MDAFWIILTGILVASTCSLLGCFLLLRKMTMIGDAISHAVLPGIVLAYLLSGTRETIFLLLGAGFFGFLTTVGIEFLLKKAALQTDASIGLIFTFLFAIGIILITKYTGQVDLDQDCVLYGEIIYVPLFSSTVFPAVPHATFILFFNFIFVISFIILFFKPLQILSFNADFARSIGFSVSFWHYFLMLNVSITTVLSFESIGAILVLAFLVVPPATAYLLTYKLKNMLFLSVIFSCISVIIGYIFADFLNVSMAASMAVSSGFLFFSSFCFQIRKILAPKLKFWRQ